MLAADRMIRRFVAAALSVPLNKVTADVAGDAVTRAADILGDNGPNPTER